MMCAGSFFKKLNLLILVSSWVLTPNVSASSLSQPIFGKVQNALSFVEKGKSEKGLFILETLHLRSAYDKAYVNKLLGVLYWEQQRGKDAIEALTLAVKLETLERSEQIKTQKMLADILLSESRYQDALVHYYALLGEKTLRAQEQAEIWLRVANGHFYLNAFKKALAAMNKHLNVASPTVSALSLKLAIEQKSEKWTDSTQTLKYLIALEPMKKTWWLQLTQSYQKLNDPKSMLKTLILSERRGVSLSDPERQMLAQLYAQEGVPQKAAEILSTRNKKNATLQSTVLEASFWQQAKEWEKAMLAWKKAAKINHQYAWNLAQLQIQEEQYKAALETLAPLPFKEKSVSKEKAAQIEITRTHAYHKLGQIQSALIHAQKAHALSASPYTKSWLEYLLAKTNTHK